MLKDSGVKLLSPEPVDLTIEGIGPHLSVPTLTTNKPFSDINIEDILSALEQYGSAKVDLKLESSEPAHSGFYADVHFVMHHGQRAIAVKMIGGDLGTFGQLDTSIENLGSDIETLLKVRGTEHESIFPPLLGIAYSSDNKAVALVTEMLRDQKELFKAIDDGDVTVQAAREQIEGLLVQLEERYGLYLWDVNRENFVRDQVGNWRILDPASLVTRKPEDPEFNRKDRLDGLFIPPETS